MSELNDLLMPKLGLTMTEGLLSEWCVSPGDAVSEGDVIFIVETDKVATEVSAQAGGTIGELLVQEGETVSVGAVVARWTGPGQGFTTDQPDEGGAPADGASMSSKEKHAAKSADISESMPEPQGVVSSSVRVVATPLARRLAHEHGVDMVGITGSGPRGRIKAEDVRAVVSRSDQARSAFLEQAAERTPAGGVVQTMARRMVEAKQTVPHFYLATEVEVTELMGLRERLNDNDDAPKLTINHFIIAAVASALRAMPEQNRIWDNGDIVQFQSVDVGVAVSTEKGLMAPVLRDLDSCSLDDIALRATDLVDRTREGQATRDDLQGGAITISNAGMFNVTYMTPIINPPQSAILGIGSVRELFRPATDGTPVLHREMGVVLAGDHRLHDGASGLRFLNRVIELLQDPYRLLRGV
ncbi:dihydrolipoamide acetyltransferase family protein [Marinobacter oulmenensis]|uniref:Dihydrolipoamide acetyltransferase component of pyruvate dehydrogenase complex n=1 Tax=Marinobacter oulmenensis TaxID=643747 RepID=A0A840UAR6_9GAMM|nr:dihydrolipoamide acetyltransferase family protein [Marinobacter oulmenensis]MBB5319761.1 pyruvate dehydrogenase E2 component (dihydrolipoamide acetyltransferase) [Marinobacter oulmenensis]